MQATFAEIAQTVKILSRLGKQDYAAEICGQWLMNSILAGNESPVPEVIKVNLTQSVLLNGGRRVGQKFLSKPNDIGHKIRNLRKKAGLSQIQLAQLCELSSVEVSNLERGLNCPLHNTLEKLAAALNVDVESIKPFTEFNV